MQKRRVHSRTGSKGMLAQKKHIGLKGGREGLGRSLRVSQSGGRGQDKSELPTMGAPPKAEPSRTACDKEVSGRNCACFNLRKRDSTVTFCTCTRPSYVPLG